SDVDVRTLVRGLPTQLSAHRRKDAGARSVRRSRDSASLVVEDLPVLAAVFRRRKRPVGRSWRMDETYVKVCGQWKYLYRAVDRDGETVDFLLTAKRDRAAALRYLKRAVAQHGLPEKITIDQSGATAAAIESLQADSGAQIVMRQRKYLNNLVEQDH